MVLPSDFALPALPYLVGLLAALAVVAGLLYRVRPAVTAGTITAMAPWMAAGGALYAIYQVGGVPTSVAPLFGSPAVYLSVAVLAGATWLGATWLGDRGRSADVGGPASGGGVATALRILALVGTAVLVVALAGAVTAARSLDLTTSALILVAATLAAGAVWAALRRLRDVSATGSAGALVVFGHALDGVSTAVGYDVLGFAEQTPLSRIVLEVGGALPTADLVGAGWLFVVVKLALAAAVVSLFEPYVRDEPGEGFLLLGFVAAVGLGPGAHNLVLFAIS